MSLQLYQVDQKSYLLDFKTLNTSDHPDAAKVRNYAWSFSWRLKTLLVEYFYLTLLVTVEYFYLTLLVEYFYLRIIDLID